jgi:hypothetical protein
MSCRSTKFAKSESEFTYRDFFIYFNMAIVAKYCYDFLTNFESLKDVGTLTIPVIYVNVFTYYNIYIYILPTYQDVSLQVS